MSRTFRIEKEKYFQKLSKVNQLIRYMYHVTSYTNMDDDVASLLMTDNVIKT